MKVVRKCFIISFFMCILASVACYGQKVVKRQQQSKPATQGSTGTVKKNPQAMVTTGEYVDLGLPSGTLWATKNIGANKPEEYGDYFAWGETKPKKEFSWETYKWCNGAGKKQTKYCIDSSFGNNGFIDNKTELDLEDDAAYVNWGSRWRIPSYKQFNELITYCKCRRTKYKGVTGYIVKGKNGKSIFLPCGGWDGKVDEYGHYGTRSLPPKDWYDSAADAVSFTLSVNNGIYEQAFFKYTGLSIRPVRKK